jgi:glycosyltransferase involved in cell wall biosynthesis
MLKPEISIVMPVYNGGAFLKETIAGLLSQSYGDFELIIVNDGSTDSSREIIQSFNDKRIKYLSNHQNCGIVFSRNKGCSQMKGRFYAPFDADDIAHPQKMEKQLAFLKENPEFAMTGCRVKRIDPEGKPFGKAWRLSADHKQIPSIMLFRNYFVHSSLLINRKALPSGFYTKGFDVVEDYLLCADIALKNKVYILPEFLLKYRVSPTSAMRLNNERLKLQEKKIFSYLFSKLNINLTSNEMEALLVLKDNRRLMNRKMLKTTEELLFKVLRQNKMNQVFQSRQLIKTVKNRWLKTAILANGNLFWMLKKIIASPILRVKN